MPGAPTSENPATRPDRDDPAPLFEQVADRIQRLIGAGTLAPGDRVPSVREARRRFGVSAGTVVEAYKLLERRGQIRARPQSGFYVRTGAVAGDAGGSDPRRPRASAPPLRIREVPSTMTWRLDEHEVRDGMVPLGAAVPDVDLLPTRALDMHLSRALRALGAKAHRYGPAEGAAELRHEIARRMLDAGCVVSPDEIVVTNGATEAVGLALQSVAQRGDVIAVESPTYHGLLDALCAHGLRALPISTCAQDGISVSGLERALAARQVRAVAMISTFSNPLGGSLSEADRRSVVELARRHDVDVIEDDVYGDLAFAPERPPAVKAFDEEGRVLYCSSFSKTLSPGMRIGWCVPGRHRARFLQRKQELNVATAVAPQLGLAGYLGGGGYASTIRRLRRAYEDQVDAVIAQVMASFPPGTRVSRPLGGFVVWVEMPDAVDAMRLFDDAEALDISIAPGPLFDPDHQFRHCVRLNASHPFTPRIADAVATLGRLAREQLEGGSPAHRARRIPDRRGAAAPQRRSA